MSKIEVAIIGSGLGGLLTGYILAREGMQVEIFEKNDHPGGCMQSYKRNGHWFDTGLHYIGGAAPGQNLHQFFRYFGLLPDLPIKPLDPTGFERIRYQGQEFRWATGFDAFAQELKRNFPKEHSAINKYIADIQKVCAQFPLYNLEYREEHNEAAYHGINLHKYLNDLTHNKTLQTVLLGNNLLYAAEKDSTPFYLHALINCSFIRGAYRVSGGSRQITDRLLERITHFGGKIHTGTTIKHIDVKGTEARAITDNHGNTYEVKQVISAIHPAPTLQMIEAPVIRTVYRQRIETMHNSTSAFTVYLIFKPDSFPYLNQNYYILNQDSPWVANTRHNPEDYFLFLTPHEPGADKYASTATILSLMPFESVAQWEEKQDKAYDDFKQEVAERLIRAADRQFPGISGKIESYFTATPLTYKRYLGTPEGTIYGTMRNSQEPLASHVSVRTKIKNLVFAGQNANIHGVLGTTVSAVLAASQVIDLPYLVNKIKHA
ncbi:MAG: NAD(P)/FAD-dependent oxidoreductase [Bacteroidales bacterium]